MIGLWIAAWLLLMAAYGTLMFRLGTRRSWQVYQQRLDMIRWTLKGRGE